MVMTDGAAGWAFDMEGLMLVSSLQKSENQTSEQECNVHEQDADEREFRGKKITIEGDESWH